jgi:hypothetical protein
MTPQSSPPSRAWRAQVAAPETPGEEGQRWRRDADALLGRRGRRRTQARRFALGFLFLAVLLAALVWVVLWLRPARGTGVLIVTAGYEDNLAVPHNVYGREGARALADTVRAAADTSSAASGRLHLRQPPRQLVNVDDWDRDLARVPDRTILLFLALHGGADTKGAYLLPQNALLPLDQGSLEEDSTRLRLERVLDRLAKVPHDRNVVLVLDATQVQAHPRLGLLQNTFARELDRLDAKIAAIPNLVILSASDADQRSWPCEDLRRTIFAHYLIEGLQGHADGAVDSVKDSKVDASELHHYVSAKVAKWVQANRGAVQTPVLRPKGALGLERARRIHLTTVPQTLPAPATPGPAFVPPEALRAEWQAHAKLAAEVPAPWIYSPHLWRRYQDSLLRYERLLEAGDAAAAKTMAARVFDLGQQIRQARTLALGSAAGTLAMPSAGGTEVKLTPAAGRALADLWASPFEEQAKRWEKLLKSEPSGSGPSLRLALCDLILRQTAAEPYENLDKAYQLLRTLDDPLGPRPAEAHFLIMLRRGQAKPPADLFRLAVRVRQRAERAALGLTSPDQATPADVYPYSAQVVPWIRPRVDEGDKLRRLGQDLLYATGKADWDRARGLLEQADRLYQLAQEEAVRVRTAYAVRDQALGSLPYYTRWLGRRALPAEGTPPGDDAGLLAQVEQLWTDAHDLTALLETAGAKGYDATSGDGQWRGLADRATALRRALGELETRFRQQVAVLDEPDSPAAWRALDDLLAVPGGDVKLRLDVLARKAHISRKRFHEALLEAGNPPGVAPERLEEQARKSAEVQGRLALAALGRRWFDETAGLGQETYPQLRDRLAAFRTEGWRSVTTAGEEVGARWRQLPSAVAKRVEAGLKLNPAKAGPDLRTADRLTRLLGGAGSLFLVRDPPGLYRKHLVQELTIWQAERALEDHWYDEDPVQTPYYRVSGQSFLNDARRLDKRHEKIASLEKRLLQDWRLRLVLQSAPGFPAPWAAPEGPTVLHMTSEARFPLRYLLQAEESGPAAAGLPVVWAEGGSALTTEAPRVGQRLVRSLEQGGDTALNCVVSSPELRKAETTSLTVPAPQETEFRVRGLYRGREFNLKTIVRLHPLPETVVSAPPLPLTASLAVRAPREVQAQGTAKGAIAIVLDCSGSMAAPRGQPETASKFREAAAALKQVLQRVPRGTVVSIWIFGQAVEPGKTVERPEETIERVLSPTPWDPQDNDRLRDLMTKVEAYQPWNRSPILRAMWRAASEDLRAADGFKTLLVITDGMDNRFAKDDLLNQERRSPRAFLLANFRDIEVNVIGFKVAAAEQAAAVEQFKAVEELPTPGRYYTAEQSADLTIKLRSILRRRLNYRVERDDGEALPGPVQAPRDVSREEGTDVWLPGGLPPGAYRLALGGDAKLSKNVQLNRGDLLLVEAAAERGGRIGLRRVLYSEADHSLQPFDEKGQWRLAVLQNQRVGGRGLQMLLTLERRDDGAVAALEQARPAQTWVEVAPEEGKASVHRRWHYHVGYPAPAWSVESPAWPLGAPGKAAQRPVVRVWWSPELPAAGKELERGRDFRSLSDLANRPVRVDDEDAVIESVTVEEHIVETRQAFRDRPAQRERKPCLVVRVGHARGRPVLVRVKGVDPVGQEHRYYDDAGKCTALFWPVTADQAQLALKGVEVVSLTAFKRTAEKNRCSLEIKHLYEPQASDTRPLEPVDLEAAPPGEPLAPAPPKGFLIRAPRPSVRSPALQPPYRAPSPRLDGALKPPTLPGVAGSVPFPPAPPSAFLGGTCGPPVSTAPRGTELRPPELPLP